MTHDEIRTVADGRGLETAARLRLLLCCALAAASCARPHRRPSANREPVGDTDATARDASDASVARSAPDAARAGHALVPIPTRHVQTVAADMFVRRTPTRGATFATGANLSIWGSYSTGFRPVVLQQSPAPDTSPTRAWIQDLIENTRSREFVAAYAHSRDGALEVVVGPSGPSRRLGVMTRGPQAYELHVPRAHLPGGSIVPADRITTMGESEDLWVMARRSDGAAFAGLWRDVANEDVTVDVPIPFVPGRETANFGGHSQEFIYDSFGEEPGRAAPSCIRYRLTPPNQIECIVHASGGDDLDEGMYGGGDWASVRGRGIVNLRTGESSGPLGVGCTAEAGMAFRAMSDPVRLFGACTGPDAETRSLAVFTPERTYVWTEPSRLHESVSESGNHEPIILRSSTIDGPTDEILDLRDPARFSLDPPVRFPIFTTPSRQMLAVRATGASTREILLVDLDHASIQPIATYTDCAYEIVEIARTDSRIAIGCEQQPSLGSLTFVHQWAEIVDLERRVRFRTESFPEVLDPVGTDMIVSDRRRLGAESTFTFHTAWRLRLD